jgi:hypothetical protein
MTGMERTLSGMVSRPKVYLSGDESGRVVATDRNGMPQGCEAAPQP